MNTISNSADVLYHYCPTESLYGILDSMSLRLTNIRYMNDSKEISWLFELAKQVIWKEKHLQRSEAEGKLCEMLLDHCDNLYLDETFFPNVFCCCFSKNGDSLGQWRAYADDGRGVAIGFNRGYPEVFAKGDTTRLDDVDYLAESDMSKLQSDLSAAFSCLAKSPFPSLVDGIKRIARETENVWDSRAPLCKNAAFEEEDEVRLVHVGNVNEQVSFQTRIWPIQFSCRNNTIAPYIELPLDPSAQPITKIVLGPRSRAEHSRSGIMEFARSKGVPMAISQFEVSSASYGDLRRILQLPAPPW